MTMKGISRTTITHFTPGVTNTASTSSQLCSLPSRSRVLATPRLAGRLRNTRSEPQRSCQTVMLWARRVGDAPCRQNCPGPETSRTVGPWTAYSLCLGFWQEVGHANKLSVPQDVCLGYTIRPICQGYIPLGKRQTSEEIAFSLFS